MLTLENISFGVKDEKGEKEIIKNLNLSIGENKFDRANMGISYAFQQPVRFKGIQVLDLIRLAAKRKMSAADACEYLSEVGLCAKDYINREVNASLSGGELKRIEIATVLARGTKLSVFDEPERILNIADEIVVIADGQISAQGSKDEILPKLLGTASAVDACSMFYKGEK